MSTVQHNVEDIDEQDEIVNNSSGPLENQIKKPNKKQNKNFKRKGTRTDVLELIRNDKLKFYENYINIQNVRLAEKKRKNDLQEEKNKLLKEYLARKTNN